MIERSHRIGPKKRSMNSEAKTRPIIAKFVSNRDRQVVFNSKKLLKESGFVITESLTKKRMSLLNEGRKTVGSMVLSLSSGKGKMFLCAARHAFTSHVNAWKNLIGIVVQIQARGESIFKHCMEIVHNHGNGYRD